LAREVSVNDSTRTALAVFAGAAVGGFVGYVLFTDSGRRLRRRFEPVVDGALKELGGVAGAVSVMRALATEGKRVWDELAPPPQSAREWNAPIRQQNPF
jgi:hypothetical protein